MKREKIRKKPEGELPALAILRPQEKKALKNAILALNSQAEALGTLDPAELEPVLIYSLKEKEK